MRNLPIHAAVFAGLLPLLFTACASSAAGPGKQRTIAADTSFPMAAGEQVALAGSGMLRYLRVANDSRCPPGVQCVWAGDAEVVFEWSGNGAQPETFSLHTGRGARSHDLGKRRLTLESLERGANPEAQLRLDAIP